MVLKRCAPRQRRALLLHTVEGWSYADIAQAEGISVSSTKSLLFHARDNLKRACKRGLFATLLLPVAALGRRARTLANEIRVRYRVGAEPAIGAAGSSLVQTATAIAVAIAALTPQGVSSAYAAIASRSSVAPSAAPRVVFTGANPHLRGARIGSVGHDGLIGSLLHPTREATPENTQFTSIQPSPDYENDHTLVAAGRVQCASTLCPVLFISQDGGATWRQRSASGFKGQYIMLPPAFPKDRRIFAMGPDGLEISKDLGLNFRTALPVQGQAAISPLFDAGDPRVLVANAVVIEYWASTDSPRPATMVGPAGQWLTVTFSPTFATDGVVIVGGLRATKTGAVRSAVYRCANALCGTTDLAGATGAPRVRASSRFDADHLLYAFTSDALFRSADSGDSFSAVPIAFDRTTLAIRDALVTYRGGRPAVLAAMSSTHANASGVYRSLDGGATWSVSQIGTPGFENGPKSLFAIPGGRVFAVGINRGLACSDDNGLTWRARCGAPRS